MRIGSETASYPSLARRGIDRLHPSLARLAGELRVVIEIPTFPMSLD